MSSNRVFTGLLSVAVIASCLVAIVPTAAEAATKCREELDFVSVASKKKANFRVCYKTSTLSKRSQTVERVEVRNRPGSKAAILAKCEFETSFSQQSEVSDSQGGSVSATVEGGLFLAVKAAASVEYNITVGKKFSQSAATATRSGLQAKIKPGQKLVCTRKNVQVSTTVTRTVYRPAPAANSVTKYKVKNAPEQMVRIDAKVVKIS